jgi:cysteinyl-tRNA synthetase
LEKFLQTDTRPALHLYNTMSRRLERFAPRRARTVKIFTCGPSIYGRPHLGNYRTFVYEDILHRYLEYRGYKVQRLINFTDVEDKAVAQAERSLVKLRGVTENAAEGFFENTGLLHLKMPDYIPRSSTSVEQAVRLIQKLLDKGIAYRLGADIFYDPLQFPGFGKLSGLDMSRWPEKKRRYRKDTYAGNRWNLGDFILWHGYRPQRDGDIFWETGLGRGRPAWNVQDPAMITKNLGFEIDIACGGIDNLFRHHDYNIAVIEAVSGTTFANYWLHGEHVLLAGKKMSKSKGNIVYPRNLLDRGFSAAAIRYCLGAVHYRAKLDLTDELLAASQKKCRELQELARYFTGPLPAPSAQDPDISAHIDRLATDFAEAMDDDLRVGSACDNLLAHLRMLAGHAREKGIGPAAAHRLRKQLLGIDRVLQLMFE